MRGRGLLFLSAGAALFTLLSQGFTYSDAASVDTDGREFLIAYETHVLPILQKKCSSCHTQEPEKPFFYDLPLVSRWARPYIDRKLKLAITSFDIFGSVPREMGTEARRYAKKILRALEEERMPPKAFLFIHPEKKLSEDEVEIIRDWVSDVEKG